MRMVREHPPHRSPERFKQIQTAYETLGKPELRRSYTELLLHGGEISRLMDTARQALESEDWSRALKSLNRLATIHPSSPDVFFNKGVCHFMLDQIAKGHEAYRECLHLSPESIDYRIRYADSIIDCAMRIVRNNRTKAIALLNDAREVLVEAERIGPGDADIAMTMARCELLAGHAPEAETWVRKSIMADNRIDAHDIDRFILLLHILISSGKTSLIPKEMESLRNGIGSDSELCHFAASRMVNMAVMANNERNFTVSRAFTHAAVILWPDSDEIRQFYDFSVKAVKVQESIERYLADQGVINPVKRLILVYYSQFLDINVGFEREPDVEIRTALEELSGYQVGAVKQSIEYTRRRFRELYDLNSALFNDLLGHCENQIQASMRPRGFLDEAADFLRKIFS